jgi:H+/Cl- antiporter ClcA
LVLEMTDTHGVILQLMIAAIIAQSAAKMVDPISFYEHMSERFLRDLGVEVIHPVDPNDP